MKKSIISIILTICLAVNLIPAGLSEINVWAANTPNSLKFDINWEADADIFDLSHIPNGTKVYYYNPVAEESTYLQLKAVLKDADGNEITDTEVLNSITWWLGTTEGVTELNGLKIYTPETTSANYPTLEITPDVVEATTRIYAQWTDGATTLKANIRFRTVGSLSIADFSGGAIATEDVFSVFKGSATKAFENSDTIIKGNSQYSGKWYDILNARTLKTSLININDLSYYNNVNLMVYSKDATGTDIGVMFYDENDSYFRTTFKLDFSGWKLVSLPFSSFFTSSPSGTLPSWSNLTEFGLTNNGWNTVEATENDEIYFDRIWLSSTYPYEENGYEFEILNMNSEALITASKATANTTYTKNAAFSAAWGDMTKTPTLTFNNVPRDWSTFDHIELNIYSESKTNATVKMLINTDPHEASGGSYFNIDFPIDWQGWKTFTYRTVDLYPNRTAQLDEVKNIQFVSSGWGLTSSSEPRIYIDSIMAYNYPDDFGSYLPFKYNTRTEFNTISAQVNALYSGSDNALINGVVTSIGNKVRKSGGILYAPSTAFTSFGYTVPADITSKAFNGVTYYPVKDVLNALGKNYAIIADLVVISSPKNISKIKNNAELIDFINYMITYKKVTTLTNADFEAIAANLDDFYSGSKVSIDDTTNVSQKVSALNSSAKNFLATVNMTDTSTPPLSITVNTSDLASNTYNMLGKVVGPATAYANPLSEYYKDEELLEAIKYCLDYSNEHFYGKGIVESSRGGNWWNWEIGAPLQVVKICIMIRDELTEEEINNYMYPINYLLPRSFSTISNKALEAMCVLGAAVLQKDAKKVIEVRDSLDTLFRYTESGDGFYKDGSYIMHTNFPYIGAYGEEMFKGVLPIVTCLNGTTAEFVNPYTNNIFNWISDSLAPFMHQGIPMDMVNGRKITEFGGGPSTSFLLNLLSLTDIAEDDNKAMLESFIKRSATSTVLSSANGGSSTTSTLIKLKKIINDPDISEGEYNVTKAFHNSDRVVRNTSDYAVGISMNSARIAAYESINGENMKGWYTNEGAVYIYNKATGTNSLYGKKFFSYANPYRIPGTTVDTKEREAVSIQGAKTWRSDERFVGGVTLDDKYVTAAMQLDAYNYSGSDTSSSYNGGLPYFDCDLEAKKSWFIFDDEVVCLGADIKSTRDNSVETTVENSRHDLSYNVIVDGETMEKTNSYSYTSNNASWAHIQNIGGYVFPNKDKTLNVRRYTNTYGFTEMWFDHGKNPSGAEYAYVILPTKTAEETADYAENNDITILSNTASVQSVYDKSTDSTGTIFWSAGTFDGITTNQPILTMKNKEDGILTFTVSDPTQNLSSATVTFNATFLIPEEIPDNVTVTKNADNIKLDYNLENSKGATFTIKFRDCSDTYKYQFNSETNKLTASFDVINPMDDSTTLKAIVAKYNSSDKLILAEFNDIPLTSDEIISSYVETSLDDEEISYVKIYIWNGLTNINPLSFIGKYEL